MGRQGGREPRVSAGRDARIRRYWDRHAATFDRAIAPLEASLLAESRRWVAGRASGETLEVAIGTGLNLPHYGVGVRLTGLELSERMLDEARGRAGRLGRPVDLVRGDAQALPFRDASFDAVVCTYSLCGIADERAALAEMLRVLRPDGSLLLADHVAATNPVLRVVQGLLDVVTVPWHGEHFSRRPRVTAEAFGVRVIAADRLHHGVIERLHARPR